MRINRIEGNMKTAELTEKMIAFSKGNIHDIDHFIRVWTYAKTIGELEGADSETQFIIEAAALVHDIACPLCREKYGNTNGKNQEREGENLTREFLGDSGLSGNVIDRIAYLVGHHHTLCGIDGLDYQILIEADYIANASENGYDSHNVGAFTEKYFKTESGKRIAKSVLCEGK